MKKLMMLATAVTIVGSAQAWIFCADEDSTCTNPGWDLVIKGKSADLSSKGYKKVYTFSQKGAILGTMTPELGEGTSTTTDSVVDTPIATNDVTVAAGWPGVFGPMGFPPINGTNWLPKATNDLPNTKEYYLGYGYTRPVGTVTNPAVGAVLSYYEADLVTVGIVYTNAADEGFTRTENVFLSGKLIQYNRTVTQKTTTTEGEPTGECCLDATFSVYLYDKAEKELVKLEGLVEKFTVFGDAFFQDLKAGKSKSVESDVMFTMADEGVMLLQFVGFGKAKYGMSKAVVGNCGPSQAACKPIFGWPSWTGWFTGVLDTDSCDLASPICDFDCEDGLTVAGGTWQAKFNKKLTTERSIYSKFKVSYDDDFEDDDF